MGSGHVGIDKLMRVPDSEGGSEMGWPCSHRRYHDTYRV